jgi:hypothetical protein
VEEGVVTFAKWKKHLLLEVKPENHLTEGQKLRVSADTGYPSISTTIMAYSSPLSPSSQKANHLTKTPLTQYYLTHNHLLILLQTVLFLSLFPSASLVDP